MADHSLILASASPRRRDLLDQLGVRYAVEPAHIDEAQRAGEDASGYVRRVAQDKAQAVAARFPNPECVVLAADTTVVLDGTVLGKPQDKSEAMAMLSRLSGRWHTVLTAVCLHSAGAMECQVVATEVEFVALSPAVCAAYLATPEAWDKAGAYGIQGLGGAFVRSIRGSYSNVVGLPLCETWQMLCAHGIATALTPARSA
jgi:septum formation protein